MARSRYSTNPIIDGKYYSSFALPRNPGGLKNVDLLEGVKVQDYVWKRGDRMDHLAARFLGDDQYWWVIALVNTIDYAFNISPGRVLKIPANVQDILDRVL